MAKKWTVLVMVTVVAQAVMVIGCSGGGQKISPEQQKAWSGKPPKNPPPEFKGNQLGSPGAPPPKAQAPTGK